jgi:hypothetical protein
MKILAYGIAIAFVTESVVADAQVRVSPTGVSVSSMSATTVFLTFGGLRNQRPVDAYWCGELVAASPGVGTRCDPATLYGRLPARYDLSQLSTAGGVFTDIMSIPPSVARVAYQAAQRGATSTFFYVRRFQSLTGGPDEYVAVTCRLTGGGARSPFSLTDVHLQFDGQDVIPFVTPGESPPRVAARIAYTGTGRLTGRWEVVLPGENSPATRDLVTEASLPIDQRSSQRRFTQLERFSVFLPPDGRVTLPGPDPSRLPSAIEGTYQVLLRVEASDDREGDSNLSDAGAGVGVIHSGAVAGFPLPVLRYIVAGEGARTPTASRAGFRLLGASDGDTLNSEGSVAAMWLPPDETGIEFYRLELATDRGDALLGALLPRTARRYDLPAWAIAKGAGTAIRWRVSALAASGTVLRSSAWRRVKNGATLPSPSAHSVSRRNHE